MSCYIHMIRYDSKNVPFLKQEFLCPISMSVIKQLMHIENTHWDQFCFSPFYSLSKFILANIRDYPLLQSYITTNTKSFDFSYQYISDVSILSKVICTTNDSTLENNSYIEKWIAYDNTSKESLCFFELEHSKA